MFDSTQVWLLSGVGSLIVLVAAWFAKNFLLPYLTTERKRRMAKYILLIADEITDYFVLKYPEEKWAKWIDQAVDKIIEVTGVEKEVALRAAQAALARKSKPVGSGNKN